MKNDLTYYFVLFSWAVLLAYSGLFNNFEIKSFFGRQFKYIPSYEKNFKKEINLIYIGRSKCKYSNSASLYEKVDLIKSLIIEKSKKYNVGFNAVGIAAEWDPHRGINHLKKFGNFDEIISGNNWHNNGVVKYVGEMGFESSTPQIILTLKIYTDYIHAKVTEEKR